MDQDAKDALAGAGVVAAGCGVQLLLTGLSIAIGLWIFLALFS